MTATLVRFLTFRPRSPETSFQPLSPPSWLPKSSVLAPRHQTILLHTTCICEPSQTSILSRRQGFDERRHCSSKLCNARPDSRTLGLPSPTVWRALRTRDG